jgi:histidine triad (HIT) family protein
MGADDCIFCKIADGRIKSDLVYEDDVCVAFNDLDPQAPTHILVIPRRHIDSLAASTSDDEATLGHVLGTAAAIAREKGFAENGFRVVLNTNSDGGQTVFHLHAHLLAGRQFIFPPG